MAVNSVLMALATDRIERADMQKMAVVLPGSDPASGGMPPGDPAAAGGMPPGMPPGGGMPMDPAMAGSMPPPGPPMDPATAGGMPPGMPMDPSMAGGMPPAPPNLGAFDPTGGMAAAGAMPPAAAPAQKMKPEDMFRMIQFQMYNLQQQLTALLNAMGVQIPPGALILPPGSSSPPPESAVPGGPQDPAMQPGGQQGGQAGGAPSAIQPVSPIQGAFPMGSPDGSQGQPKMASVGTRAAATAAILRSAARQQST